MNNSNQNISSAFYRLLGGSSFFLASLYVIGFIYLKTYLAHFEFQIELASLSITNLLLANRFFVTQHIFVFSGILHGFLLREYGLKKHLETPFLSLFVFTVPITIRVLSYLITTPSESGISYSVNIFEPHIWLVGMSGWIVSGVAAWYIYDIFKRIVSDQLFSLPIRAISRLLIGVVLFSVIIGSYRLYAKVNAIDHSTNNEFLRIEIPASVMRTNTLSVCDVVYVDTENFFLKCSGEPYVITRKLLDQYRVVR